MKVLFITFRFFPQRGGSETYTHSLAKNLREKGFEVAFATLGPRDDEYHYDGFKVWSINYEDYAKDDVSNKLNQIISCFDPPIIHFHFLPSMLDCEFYKNCSVPDRKLIFTMHHPQVLCPKGDFVRFGSPCKHIINSNSCFPCVGVELGAPKPFIKILNKVPKIILDSASRIAPKGRLRTCIDLKNSLSIAIEKTKRILVQFNKIIVLADWARNRLIDQGVSEEKIKISRLGTHHTVRKEKKEQKNGNKIRFIYVGRLDKTKGLLVVLDAFEKVSADNLILDIYGPMDSASNDIKIMLSNPDKLAKKVTYKGILNDSEVVQSMLNYDCVIVPSITFETGPYTVIEAFQAGVPVLGSDVPGINEMVIPGVNGYLLPLGSVNEWVKMFKKISTDPGFIRQLKINVSWQRSMEDVADDIIMVYQAC